jgi:WW domain
MNEVARTDSNPRSIPDKLCNPYDISYVGDGLPPGWKVRHNLGGRTYHIDHNTKCTTWTRPSKQSRYVAPVAPAISREVSQRAPDQFITDPTYE